MDSSFFDPRALGSSTSRDYSDGIVYKKATRIINTQHRTQIVKNPKLIDEDSSPEEGGTMEENYSRGQTTNKGQDKS